MSLRGAEETTRFVCYPHHTEYKKCSFSLLFLYRYISIIVDILQKKSPPEGTHSLNRLQKKERVYAALVYRQLMGCQRLCKEFVTHQEIDTRLLGYTFIGK